MAPLRSVIAACLLAATGCNLAPRYDSPKTETVAAFKEAGPAMTGEGLGWKIAGTEDGGIHRWWEVYGDPDLDELELRVAISNQSIIAAEASYRAAYALAQQAQAQLLPTLSLAPAATREKSSAAVTGIGGATATAAQTAAGGAHNLFSVPLEAAYQIDLWGSVRNTVAENRFAAQASAAQLANALLSTQSTLAQDYFQLRVADEQRRIVETTVADYQASLRLVHALVDSGVDSEADIATAETQLKAAMAAATDVGVARAQYEHAIAVLIGVSPSTFSLPYKRLDQASPPIPVGVPSDLLEHRPDIAAAERQVAESNAQIGVARAAFFPTLTLSATGGYESTAISNLFNVPNRFWSIGPTLAQVLFDGGARRAATAQARAQNDSQVATYRQTVLTAFQSVEDTLAALRILSTELGQAHEATVSAKRAVELTVVLYRNGVDSYVNVIAAQNAFLAARQTELGVQLRQLTSSVNLINDLGGGWSSSQLEKTAAFARHPPATSTPGAVEGAPNPPPMPSGEIQPDDLMKQNEESIRSPDR